MDSRERADKASALADQFTARELAEKVAMLADGLAEERQRSSRYRVALADIAAGHWTAEGAVQEARRALRP